MYTVQRFVLAIVLNIILVLLTPWYIRSRHNNWQGTLGREGGLPCGMLCVWVDACITTHTQASRNVRHEYLSPQHGVIHNKKNDLLAKIVLVGLPGFELCLQSRTDTTIAQTVGRAINLLYPRNPFLKVSSALESSLLRQRCAAACFCGCALVLASWCITT